MASEKLNPYNPLLSSDDEEAAAVAASGDPSSPSLRSRARPASRVPWTTIFLSAALLVALAANALLTLQCSDLRRKLGREESAATPYAGLKYDVDWPVRTDTEWGPKGAANKTLSDNLWESIHVGTGMVALKHDHAKSMGLPAAQDFPWDNSRGLYFLAAHHSLHCLKKLRRSYELSRRGEPQMDTYEHIAHCFDVMRQDIVCHADDTPFYTTSDDRPILGEGQPRKCRDFAKLERWARENEACFAYTDEADHHVDQMQRYRFCRKGSEFGANMRSYFGYPDGWYQEPIESVPPY